MANTKPIGVAYADPDFDSMTVGGVEVTPLTAAQMTALDGVTAGTVLASKAAIVDSNKDIGDFRNVDVTNLDAGASGTAGTVDVFPATASKGKLAFTAANNTGNTTTTIVNAEHGQTCTLTIPDPDAAAGSFVISTGTTTVLTATTTELDKAAGVTAGTAAASKNAVLGANKNLDTIVIADGGLCLGSGAGTAISSTAAEINKLDDLPFSVTVAVTTPGASGTCDAAFTFKNAAGATIGIAVALDFYLSTVDGLAVTGAITSILDADTPVGDVVATVTGQQGMLVTTAGGLASAKLTGAAATTYYITFKGLGGRLIVSPALLTKA